ncbi:porin [Rhizobium dioscoreae]|uniref:Porin n=1 Tax=Rhizobium dioscoreae TaxID=2653122 RepID=A0ABQ0Z7C5_9HYPH|nr:MULTISPECIES: porin [Rhizobium]MCZ3375028.1 porin [Rhizobium sp. AG207R]GES41053.1 porin [Rhizobium dioscoreae]GES51178.1 porin [Rhizobium dioscoreae]GLU82630.1 porin [Rhizobium sp. NBRC 114257]
MNIKSLLLGSAAALAAVSGAHAADAIVAAEPEPLEYVRICDAYGAGYFFIPGTETCLKIGGKVRTEGKWYDAYNPDTHFGTLWHTRAELQLQTATDTEYGPLKTNTELRWDWNDGGATATNLLHASISLGGFTVGKEDSQFNVFTGYAGDVINDDVIADGPYELNQITYNYDAGNGFTAVISLEDSNSGSGATGANGEDSHNHYAPDVVAGAGYKAGAWSFKLVGGYDSIVEEGAIKARVDADFGVFSAFLMGAWNTDGDKLNKYAPGDSIGQSWGDWAVWGGVGVPVNEKLKWNLQLAYTDNKTFSATTNVKWKPVKNLLIEPEVTYTNWDSINQDQWAGILRFERTF